MTGLTRAMGLALSAGLLAGSAAASADPGAPPARPATLQVPGVVPSPPPRPAAEAPRTAEAFRATEAPARANLAFERWIAGFRQRALAQGIRPAVFDAAFADVRYNTDVIARDRSQAEFTRTIWDYLDSAVSQTRIETGREMLRRHARLLGQIERRFGVEKEVVVAIWGMESAYGARRGTTPIIAALATLAHDGRRGAFFEAQLLAALEILQAGDTTPERMVGSWAGAMGHTQFIPTSFQAFAVDFTGDGRRDIWGDDPADALASAAAYLARHGWTKGQPWGVEVVLPQGFDYALARRDVKRSAAQWAGLGVRAAGGGALPDKGRASVLLPAGARGAAFLIYDNFRVIERYNAADAYVIGVGHLSDRLAGGGPIRASWPRGERALTSAERRELQERLTRAGFDTKGVDGRIGPNTVAALRAFQKRAGLVPDGFASSSMLDKLR